MNDLFMIAADATATHSQGPLFDFLNNNIVFTIINSIIGFIVSATFTFKKRSHRNITIVICAILFNIYMFLRAIYIHEPIYVFISSLVISTFLCFTYIIFLREKDIISRKKINKMIIDFTSKADAYKDVCIFGGDLNFFGDVVKEKQKTSNNKVFFNLRNIFNIHKSNRENINHNKQLNQLIERNFRKICILCIKPSSEVSDKDDRVRIGYIKNKLCKRVNFKFFKTECENCKYNDRYNCNIKQYEDEKDESTPISNDGCKEHIPSLPDNTLRGRIVTNKETGAKCVAITTKKAAGKKYILRQYGSEEKECSLYIIIWNIWWKLCEEDNEFVNNCEKEYLEYTKE